MQTRTFEEDTCMVLCRANPSVSIVSFDQPAHRRLKTWTYAAQTMNWFSPVI